MWWGNIGHLLKNRLLYICIGPKVSGHGLEDLFRMDNKLLYDNASSRTAQWTGAGDSR